MTTSRRLIEETFPLKKVSEDSVHENTVNSVKISSLHVWPAGRPLAACRAIIIASLLPDSGDEQTRQDFSKKIGSITHWGSENGVALDYFRQEIRKAYNGRSPRILDMFAGGGAIPIEAMRLGCDVTAVDYNPVAWFVLKCTLEFPQHLAGKTWPLPEEDKGKKEKKAQGEQLRLLDEERGKPGDLAEHVRYWGKWVLKQARAELAEYYPTIDGQPTVAYLWARTVPCPDPACGTEVPLLKSLWLCKRTEKTLPDTPENRIRPDFLRIKKTKNTNRVVINARRALHLIPNTNAHRVDLEIWTPSPKDQVPEGTMAGAKSRCPVCGVNLTPDYIKTCGYTGKLGARITAVVVDTNYGKEYRLSTLEEETAVHRATSSLPQVAEKIPYGLPNETQEKNPRTLIVQLYGMNNWSSVFTHRQLLSLLVLVKWTLFAKNEMINNFNYPTELTEAVMGYLSCVIDRLVDHNATLVRWMSKEQAIDHTFQRNVIPMTWDFAEAAIINSVRGGYKMALGRTVAALELAISAVSPLETNVEVAMLNASTLGYENEFDAIITDPPYYNAIPYGDLSDFFYVWLRRIIGNLYPLHYRTIFGNPKEKVIGRG